MESLDVLKQRKQELENELKKITVEKHGSTPWAPGVYDQHKSDSYSYKEYTDSSKAYKLKDEIEYIDNQIRTYAERARQERERAEFIKDSQTTKYEYTQAGETKTTTNPAIAARYNAQARLFGMSKVKQTMMTITGQKKKFKKLWLKGASQNAQTQEQVAEELNKMFR